MENNRRQILDMLAGGQIAVEEAERLLTLVSAEDGDTASGQQTKERRASPKYLRVCVEPDEGAGDDQAERVNIRVPIALIRAGLPHPKFGDGLGERKTEGKGDQIRSGQLEGRGPGFLG